jgi:hypothetical protein
MRNPQLKGVANTTLQSAAAETKPAVVDAD